MSTAAPLSPSPARPPTAHDGPDLDEHSPLPRELWPDVSHLVTEDDTPMDNLFSEKQQRLLVDSLEAGWRGGSEEIAFAAAANVGLYFAIGQSPLVPDFLLSLDVGWPDDLWMKEQRCYMTWMFGKAPELVIEIVSNRVGGEENRKRAAYARGGVDHYVIYDPTGQLSETPLRCYRALSRRYEPVDALVIPGFPLTLRPWQGAYERKENTWLRWFDLATGALIPTGRERADAEQQRADRLADRLRALGVDSGQV